MKLYRLIYKNNFILKGLRSIFRMIILLIINALTLLVYKLNKHSVNKWVIMSILFFSTI